MLFDKNDAQLILVSCQETVCAKSIDPEEFSAQVQKLARVAQIFQIPIWSAVHMPHVWGDYMKACQAFCERPMESALFSAADMLSPHLNPVRNPSAGNARSLPKHLQKPTDHSEPQRPLIVLAGCEVHVGVVQTALDLMDLGYEPIVVVDACTAMLSRDRDAAFDRLASVGVELTTVDMLCMEWLRSSKATESTAIMQALGKF
jgi:nicotinamidase-related amidase